MTTATINKSILPQDSFFFRRQLKVFCISVEKKKFARIEYIHNILSTNLSSYCHDDLHSTAKRKKCEKLFHSHMVCKRKNLDVFSIRP